MDRLDLNLKLLYKLTSNKPLFQQIVCDSLPSRHGWQHLYIVPFFLFYLGALNSIQLKQKKLEKL